MKTRLLWLGLALLTACGGGGGGDDNASAGNSRALADLCAQPRSGTADRQGTLSNEKAYLRAFVDETYLWYQDVPQDLKPDDYATAQDYFAQLKTRKKTASGADVDQFHWSQTTESYRAAASGIEQDYGIQWAAQASSPPRNWIVAEVAPGSPAAGAGVRRGDVLTSIDGFDFVEERSVDGVAALNEGLFPTVLRPHRFGFNGRSEISLTPASYTVATVQNVKIIPTATGAVGYFVFDSHLAKSEAELSAAITQLKAANITDLVIDLRYNGGGLVYIASELAYMIAGPRNTAGRTFTRLTYNDKRTAENESIPFLATGSAGQALPYLGLSRVSLLVTRDTASASEGVINSLRGVDLEVVLIGDTTRGKPYGFVPQDNCSYTYFAIQFKSENDKGYGDYADGFSPDCAVADDYSHLRGDPEEAMLKTALAYRQSSACPAKSGRLSLSDAPRYSLVRPPGKEALIYTGWPGR
jgi:C-terminal processing protease CtpA/Prc